MYGLPKNQIWNSVNFHDYNQSELIELRHFIIDSYYNAFIRHQVGDTDVVGQYLTRVCCLNGKIRTWQIYAYNDFYMERDGLQVFEKYEDRETELIVELSNWELERMWVILCH